MINLFRILHVFFASMTIALFPIGIFIMGRIKKSRGTAAELSLMQTMMLIGKTIGMIGGLGILVFGGALTGVEHYAWFSFSEFPWLAWKQTIFVLILIVNFAFVMPASKKLGPKIGQLMATGGASGATDEIRAEFGKIGRFAIIMNLLTLTAMTLGVSKGVF
ncbi:MAG TPA: hypothetical protein VEW28_05645 [Candidatus Kapabacteria bacterium]|nr:hypothetical protein [Candidatus Kapabacteria bacterium]